MVLRGEKLARSLLTARVRVNETNHEVEGFFVGNLDERLLEIAQVDGRKEQMRQQLQAERQQLFQQLAGSAGDVRRAEDEARLFEAMFAQFQAIRDSGLTCFGCGEELAAFDRKLAEIGKNIEDAKRNRDPKLVADLERLAAEVKTANRLKTETQDASTRAHSAKDRAEGAYEDYMKNNREVLAVARRARARQLLDGFPQSREMSDYRSKVAEMAAQSLSDRIAGLTADRENRSTNRRSTLMREMTGAVNKHGQDFYLVPPFTAEEATPSAVEQWAVAEKDRLDGHELVQYAEQCRNAETEMTSAFRDDLLHRLDDAFTGIKSTLNELNRHLKDRQFHGRDYYSFKALEAPTHVARRPNGRHCGQACERGRKPRDSARKGCRSC
ncbi:hypothetical protein ABIF81_007797 [Bradyrhizobium daqingense]